MWIKILELYGMYGAGFDVAQRALVGLRLSEYQRFRGTNEDRGLTPIVAQGPTRNYALPPRQTKL